MKYSFLHSLGRVTWPGRKGYMKVSKLGRHQVASVSVTFQSVSVVEVVVVEEGGVGERRAERRVLKPGISASVWGR